MGNQFCPVEIQFITKEKLVDYLLGFPLKSTVCLVLSLSKVERFQMESVIRRMRDRYILLWIEDAIANPTQADLYHAVKKIGNLRPEYIIAIGGGSTIDLAKGISAFYDIINEGASIKSVTEKIIDKNYQVGRVGIPVIAIPTTAGTGSEVTKWATIWDMDKKAKYSIDALYLSPKAAIICPELTLTVPARLTLATALDALAHAMEAYWAKASTLVVQDIAYRSVQIIHDSLEQLLKDLDNIELRKKLCQGSILAGIAFSNTRTTACHSISYPLTMRYGVEHGYAVALTLSEVCKINSQKVPEINNLLRLFNGVNGFEKWLDKITKEVQPLSLSCFGIKEENIEELVELSFTVGRMDNNPVDISPEQVKDILKKAL